MSHDVLMVSRSSAYFHLDRSYLRLAAEAAAEATAVEERFSCQIIISFDMRYGEISCIDFPFLKSLSLEKRKEI